MSDIRTERLAPLDEDVASPVDDLDALEASLDDRAGLLEQPDLVVSDAPPPPLGKSLAWDRRNRRFTGRTTHGTDSLVVWIDHCLETARGQHAIFPEDFGLENPWGGIGYPRTHPDLADRGERIRDALTFHPRIADVTDYLIVEPDEAADEDAEEVFRERFRVVLDDDSTITVERTVLG